MSGHTPGKLRLDPDHNRTIQILFEGEWIMLADVHGPTWSHPSGGRKNARYRKMTEPFPRRIVTAWNAHDALVAACEEQDWERGAYTILYHSNPSIAEMFRAKMQAQIAAVAKAQLQHPGPRDDALAPSARAEEG